MRALMMLVGGAGRNGLGWPGLAVVCFLLLSTLPQSLFAQAKPAEAADWWPATLGPILEKSGTNRMEMLKALRETPAPCREGLVFLLENMPGDDLRKLTGAFLIENTTLAYDAFQKAPWRDSVSKELFLNEILPYANINETREPWRKRLREICEPLVQDCKTPGEAAHRLNQKLFGIVKVKYSTQRKKANQSPSESMETGLASCTGLTIMLVDACRSVGVPARLVGIPNWVDNRGNHTWTEIWDQKWHFAGSAEPDGNGLDHGWFQHDASLAQKDSREHAIYAASFQRTPLPFPMVWATSADYVSAVNVTDHYTPAAKQVESGKVRLLVRVFDRPAGSRVAAHVAVREASGAKAALEGTSKDEKFDTNDILSFEVDKTRAYRLEADLGGRKAGADFGPTANSQDIVTLFLDNRPSSAAARQSCARPPQAAAQGMSPADATSLRVALSNYFAASPTARASWNFSPALDQLVRDDEDGARQICWEVLKGSSSQEALRKDYEARQVRFEQHLSPYTIRTVGKRPESGWPVFIAMHGGGGAPQEVNDSQWKIMQRYYRDQDSVPGYIYLALRAPNNVWNGFYDVYVYPLIANLTKQLLLFADADPNKIFLMGYSHGGYGAFAIGPKMPDHFAAIHSSAAAPTDGEYSAKNLRNTVFTYMIGENDHDYGRLQRCRNFDELVSKLKSGATNAFPVTMEFRAGFGHGGLPDRDKIKDMYPAIRNPAPAELSWEMTDTAVKNFFWLKVPAPGKSQEISATCQDNKLVVATKNVKAGEILLDSRLVDFSRPVSMTLNGKTSTQTVQPSLRVLCQTMEERGDPDLAFAASIPLEP